jgi:hypothetical protein
MQSPSHFTVLFLGYILQSAELAKHIFNVKLIPSILDYMNKTSLFVDKEASLKLQFATARLKELNANIDKLVSLLLNTTSPALLERLKTLEADKANTENVTAEIKRSNEVSTLSKRQLETVFVTAQRLFIDGSLQSLKTVCDTLIDKVVIYPDHVEIKFAFRKSTIMSRKSHYSAYSINSYVDRRNHFESTYWYGGGEGS